MLETDGVEPSDHGAPLTISVAGAGPEEPGRTPIQQIWHQTGGLSGLIYSSLPVVVFVIGVSRWSLVPALIAALTVAALVLVWRLIRRDSLQPAMSGFFSVGFSALIAYLLGEAKGYFLIGIWVNAFWGAVFLISIIVRRPAVGYAWSWATGRDSSWRKNRRAVVAYDIATFSWIVLFFSRFAVQQWLYVSGATTTLGWTRLAMSWPLTAIGALVTFAAIRYARKHTDAETDVSIAE